MWPLTWHKSIDSTNEEAKRLSSNGGFADQWIAAREQTAGRGRLGRTWQSLTGNLYCTAVFREPGGLPFASRAPFASALAVSDSIRSFVPGVDVRLKWPNDVRVGGAKVCGILIEAGGQGGQAWVAVGIGVNIVGVPEAAGQAATSMADLRGDAAISADAMMDSLRETFSVRLREARTDFSATIDAWLGRAEGVGQIVRVSPGGTPIEGIFEGLEPDGALVLRLSDGSRHVVHAGDVELVREII